MTQKELAYFEDAIGHEGNIIQIIDETLKNLEDANLVSFMQEELDCHKNLKETLLTKLKEKANG